MNRYAYPGYFGPAVPIDRLHADDECAGELLLKLPDDFDMAVVRFDSSRLIDVLDLWRGTRHYTIVDLLGMKGLLNPERLQLGLNLAETWFQEKAAAKEGEPLVRGYDS